MSKMSDANKKINEVTFVFFDVETTGLSPALGHRICELALVQWRENKVVATFSSLVNPGRSISRPASAVNGITNEMVEKAPYFHELAGGILRFIKDAIVVGHNVSFDLSFLNAHLRDIDLPGVENTMLDTLALSRHCYHFPSNSLGNIAKTLKLPIQTQHRALDDAILTKEVFVRFVRDFQAKNVVEISQLIELQGGEITMAPISEVAILSQPGASIEGKAKCDGLDNGEWLQEFLKL